MLTETMKIALTLTSMMIAGLSFMAFGYSFLFFFAKNTFTLMKLYC